MSWNLRAGERPRVVAREFITSGLFSGSGCVSGKTQTGVG